MRGRSFDNKTQSPGVDEAAPRLGIVISRTGVVAPVLDGDASALGALDLGCISLVDGRSSTYVATTSLGATHVFTLAYEAAGAQAGAPARPAHDGADGAADAEGAAEPEPAAAAAAGGRFVATHVARGQLPVPEPGLAAAPFGERRTTFEATTCYRDADGALRFFWAGRGGGGPGGPPQSWTRTAAFDARTGSLASGALVESGAAVSVTGDPKWRTVSALAVAPGRSAFAYPHIYFASAYDGEEEDGHTLDLGGGSEPSSPAATATTANNHTTAANNNSSSHSGSFQHHHPQLGLSQKKAFQSAVCRTDARTGRTEILARFDGLKVGALMLVGAQQLAQPSAHAAAPARAPRKPDDAAAGAADSDGGGGDGEDGSAAEAADLTGLLIGSEDEGLGSLLGLLQLPPPSSARSGSSHAGAHGRRSKGGADTATSRLSAAAAAKLSRHSGSGAPAAASAAGCAFVDLGRRSAAATGVEARRFCTSGLAPPAAFWADYEAATTKRV